MPPIDIITVCFSGDLPLLKLQIRSIHCFFPDHEIHNYHILINEDSPAAAELKRHLQGDVLPEFPALTSKTRIWTREELSSAPLPGCPGWTSQQALKLLIARKLDAEFYLVLDSKNHFLRPVSLSDFISNEKRVQVRYQLKGPPTLQWLCDSLAYFENPTDLANHPVPPTITPFTLKTSLVREMVLAIENKENCGLMDYFCRKTTETTEFFLYSSFVCHRFGTWEGHFENKKPPFSTTMFKVWPQEPAILEKVLQHLESGKIRCFGLHHSRAEALDPDTAKRLIRIWTQAGLFHNTMAAAEFLKSLGWRNG